MSCSNCKKVNCCGCQNTTTTEHVNSCAGCAETINTDCVIYNGDVLSFESVTTTNGSNRTLTSLLEQLDSSCTDRESKFIKFHSDGVTNDGNSYTLKAEDVCKILLITQFDEGVEGTITNTIILPNTAEFINKEIIFKDISFCYDAATIVIQFNQQIQYDWNPVATTNLYYSLDSTHKVLRLRLIKTSDLSYQWIVVD